MKLHDRFLKGVSGILATLLLTCTVHAQATGWRLGERLPELVLPTLDGTDSINLRQLVGEKLLLIEFASW